MRLDRIAVRDFRKLEQGVAIERIEPGITVIAGDNEEGKSTLLEALQSAFFDRHNMGELSEAVKEMMPFGAQGVRPAIEVDFELAGTNYSLRKSFGRNSEASLQGGGERLQGDSAEEKLQALLGFSRPGKGKAKADHRGLAGLLWVEQGRAFEPLRMNRDAQAGLRDAIESEVGQVLGGEHARRLLDIVEKRTGEYYSPKRKDEQKPLTEPRERVNTLREKCEELDGQLREYEDKVSRLNELKEAQERDGLTASIAKAKEEMDRANKRLQEVKEVERGAENAKARMEQAATARQAADNAVSGRVTLAQEADAASQHAREAQNAFDTLEPSARDAQETRSNADDRLDRCLQALKEANTAWDAARRMRERAVLESDLRKLGETLKRAESLEKEISQNRRALDTNPVSEEAIDELRNLRSRHASANAALDAAAAMVSFSPESSQRVLLDRQPVEAERPMRVTRPSTFHLEGFGRMDIVPGGLNLAQLRTDSAALEETFSKNLDHLGHADVDSAESALRAKQGLQEQVSLQEGELRGLAPDGIPGLREAVGERQARLSGLAGTDASGAPDAETVNATEEKARRDLEEAEDAVEQARQSQDSARELDANLQAEMAGAAEAAKQSARIAAERKQALKKARSLITDQELSDRARRAAQDFDRLRTEHDAILAERVAMDPEARTLDSLGAQEAHRQKQDQKSQIEREDRDLRVELRALGQQGLAEQLQEKQGELKAAQSDLARVEADAKAWNLLLDTLREAEREAKDAFLGPVRKHLQGYLQVLFPEAELRLGKDDLEIDSLQRGEAEEPFTVLSSGAREQIAVLTRLALADLLREKGKPVTLILDDPLVNSDDKRFRRMMLALRKAASSLQILILTCHEARYETLGAKMVRLTDCRIGS